MDVKFCENNYQFFLRTSALIFNKEHDKVLLFKVEGRDFYLLPGGKVERLEHSENSLRREMLEEIGKDYSNINFKFLAISEEFVNDKGFNNHQINIIYKGVYEKEVKELLFKGLEGEWINFEWVNIDNIDNVNIYPKQIKNAIKNSDIKYHFIEDLI